MPPRRAPVAAGTRALQPAPLPASLSEPRPQPRVCGAAEHRRISAPDMARPEQVAEQRPCVPEHPIWPHRGSGTPVAPMLPVRGSLGERRISLRRMPRAWSPPASRRREARPRMSAAAARKAAAPPFISAVAARHMAVGAAARKAAAVAALRMAGAAVAAAKASIDANPGFNPALTVPDQSRATHALMGERASQRRHNRTVVARNPFSRFAMRRLAFSLLAIVLIGVLPAFGQEAPPARVGRGR